MPDWGTKIVDAGGSYHDIAVNAFDSLSSKMHQPLQDTSKQLQKSFGDTFATLKARAGNALGIADVENLSVENIGKQLIKGVSTTVGRFGAEAIGGAVLQKVGGMEGPLGLLISEIITVGVSEFAHHISGTPSFETGQWVLLDLGMRTRKINEKPGIIEVSSGHSIFGDDFYVVPQDLEYSEEPHHGIGFVMGHAKGDYIWTVFNFESGYEEDFHEEKLREAPQSLAEKLDKTDEFSLIRDIKFLQDHDPTMKSYISSNPGDPVKFQGEVYSVVESRGQEYLIEGKDGSRIKVHSSKLEPGKTLTSGSWNRDRIGEGSFTSLSSDALFSGEWVWVRAGSSFLSKIKDTDRRRLKATPVDVANLGSDSKVLALVESIEGSKALLIRAYDGQEILEPIDRVEPASATIQRLLDTKSDSVRFKSRILDGHITDTMPLGNSLPSLTLGIGESDLTQSNTKGMHPHMSGPKDTVQAKDSIVYTAPGELGMQAMKQEQQDILDDRNKYNRTDVAFQNVVVQPIPQEENTEMGNGTLLLMGLGAVFIISALA